MKIKFSRVFKLLYSDGYDMQKLSYEKTISRKILPHKERIKEKNSIFLYVL